MPLKDPLLAVTKNAAGFARRIFNVLLLCRPLIIADAVDRAASSGPQRWEAPGIKADIRR